MVNLEKEFTSLSNQCRYGNQVEIHCEVVPHITDLGIVSERKEIT